MASDTFENEADLTLLLIVLSVQAPGPLDQWGRGPVPASKFNSLPS